MTDGSGSFVTGIGSLSAFGPRQGLVDGPAPSPVTITRWPTREPRRAFLVPAFKAGEIVPGLKTRRLDPLTVWAIVATHLALEDAGVDLASTNPARVAVVAGTGFGALERSEAFLASANRYGYASADPIIFPETLANAPAGHVAGVFGFRGPNITLSCRGVSGESALIQARSILEAGEADLAVVIAGDMLTRPLYEWYEAASVLAPACFDGNTDPPVPFSGTASGFVPGEGMAAMILEPVGLHRREGPTSYARVISGQAATERDVSVGSWGRSSAPLVRLIETLEHDAEQVRFVVSSANGAAALDRLEAEAIRSRFSGGVSVSAPKAVTGEFEASGVLRLALALSGQGAAAVPGSDPADAPAEATGLPRGFGVLLGSAAGGGRVVISLEAFRRSAPKPSARE